MCLWVDGVSKREAFYNRFLVYDPSVRTLPQPYLAHRFVLILPAVMIDLVGRCLGGACPLLEKAIFKTAPSWERVVHFYAIVNDIDL